MDTNRCTDALEKFIIMIHSYVAVLAMHVETLLSLKGLALSRHVEEDQPFTTSQRFVDDCDPSPARYS